MGEPPSRSDGGLYPVLAERAPKEEVMKVEGRCHCGAIAYEAEVDPSTVSLCHCTDCQTLSGSPYRWSVPAPAETFRLTKGEPTVYVKTSDAGTRRAQAFCAECGTPIYAAAEKERRAYSLRLGAVVQRKELAPQRQIWCRSALPFATDLAKVPGVDGQS
jgi:hypothetical protein